MNKFGRLTRMRAKLAERFPIKPDQNLALFLRRLAAEGSLEGPIDRRGGVESGFQNVLGEVAGGFDVDGVVYKRSSAWSGVFEFTRLTVHSSRDGASKFKRLGWRKLLCQRV